MRSHGSNRTGMSIYSTLRAVRSLSLRFPLTSHTHTHTNTWFPQLVHVDRLINNRWMCILKRHFAGIEGSTFPERPRIWKYLTDASRSCTDNAIRRAGGPVLAQRFVLCASKPMAVYDHQLVPPCQSWRVSKPNFLVAACRQMWSARTEKSRQVYQPPSPTTTTVSFGRIAQVCGGPKMPLEPQIYRLSQEELFMVPER